MKIESDENTSIATVVSIFLIGLFAAASHGCYQVEQTKRDAIKAGLEEQVVPGSSVAVWQTRKAVE